VYVGNLGSSIAQAGWMPRMGAWAATDMETFSLWSEEVRTGWQKKRKRKRNTAVPFRSFSLRQKLFSLTDGSVPPPLLAARSQKRFGHSRPGSAHRSAHLGDRLSGRVSRVGRERSERSRGLKRARVVLCRFNLLPRSSCFQPKGRRRAAQERGLSRSRIAVVFRAVVDGPSQGRRASGSPRRTSKPYLLPLFIRFEYVRTLVIV